jgi:hypothetical protein
MTNRIEVCMDSRGTGTERKESHYVTAFRGWLDRWKPHAFVTVNLPHEQDKLRVKHDPEFYLNCWTRCAEADVLGARSLKIADYSRRIVWMFRREVASDGLTHYHGPAWLPLGRAWRGETPGRYSISERCERLELALKSASSRTPEPYAPKDTFLPTAADILVIPFNNTERDHAGYMLKGMWRNVPEWVTDETTWDSGLIILPHLPRKGLKPWKWTEKSRTVSSRSE